MDKEPIHTISITKKTPLTKVLELGYGCKRDGKCCEFGGGFVIKDDIPRISSYLGITENQFKAKYVDTIVRFNTPGFKLKSRKTNKEYGPCIFLNQNKECLIHEAKPLHCRIGNCSEHGEALSHWFTLNHYVNVDDPESIRQWATFVKSHDTIPGGELHELVPDEKRLKKILSYEILR